LQVVDEEIQEKELPYIEASDRKPFDLFYYKGLSFGAGCIIDHNLQPKMTSVGLLLDSLDAYQRTCEQEKAWYVTRLSSGESIKVHVESQGWAEVLTLFDEVFPGSIIWPDTK